MCFSIAITKEKMHLSSLNFVSEFNFCPILNSDSFVTNISITNEIFSQSPTVDRQTELGDLTYVRIFIINSTLYI